jgi:SAM-dependent methyltransferase
MVKWKNNNRFAIDSNISIRLYNGSKKSILQSIYDFVGFPLRVILPYRWVQLLYLTDLGRERRMAALTYLKGKVLDVGCGPINQVKYEYKGDVVTCDVYQWGDVDIICPAEHLTVHDESFDTVLMLACLNHFQDKHQALSEAKRVLKPGGTLIISMPIAKLLGSLVHFVAAWFDYDRIRGIDDKEEYGMSRKAVRKYIYDSGFILIEEKGFLYNLNRLYVAKKT